MCEPVNRSIDEKNRKKKPFDLFSIKLFFFSLLQGQASNTNIDGLHCSSVDLRQVKKNEKTLFFHPTTFSLDSGTGKPLLVKYLPNFFLQHTTTSRNCDADLNSLIRLGHFFQMWGQWRLCRHICCSFGHYWYIIYRLIRHILTI